VQYPLSRDEHTAVSRYVADIKKQLKYVSDLLSARYGDNTRIADLAGKTLLSSTLLEQEMMLLETPAPEPIEIRVKRAAAGI